MMMMRVDNIKHSNTVAILGGPHHAQALLDTHEPRDVDVWWLNEMHLLKNFVLFEPYITMWFEMHPFYRMTRRSQWNHIDWLTASVENEDGTFVNHPFPIMMRRPYDRVPGSIGYPIREVVEQLPGADINTLFGCTHSWMMGLAVMLGYDKIECYGVNLVNPIETYLEKPSWAIWYGAALARGVEVDLTNSPYVLPTVLYGVKDRLAQLGTQYIPEVVTAYCWGVERYNDMTALHMGERDWQQIADIQHNEVKKREDDLGGSNG